MKWMAWGLLSLAACQFSSSTGARFGGNDRASGASDGHNVTMPNLFQLTKDQAQAALNSAGITGELQLETNHGGCGSVVEKQVIEIGHICRQMPAAGQVTSSTLFVSIIVQDENPWRGELGGGRSWYLLPDLVGLPLDQAYAKLRAAGFPNMDVFHVRYESKPGCRPGVVCEMFPEGMTRSDNSSDKSLTIGGDGPKVADPKQPPPPAPKKPGLGDMF